MNSDSSRLSLRERKKQRTREGILDAACTLFEQVGYEQTTMEMIAEQAEVSRATLFNYFPSKQSMLFPFAEMLYIRHVEPQVRVYLEGRPSLLEALRFLFLQIQQQILIYPDIEEVLRWELFHPHSSDAPASHHPFLAMLQEIIRQHQEQEGVPLDLPVEALARYVGALYTVLLYHVLQPQSRANYETEVELLLTFLEGAFRLKNE